MRRIFSILAAMAIVGTGAVAAAAVPAAAQTGYPPGLCTPTSGGQQAGSQPVGASFVVTLQPVCAWTPGTAVTVVVNGQTVGTKTASASGSVSVSVTVKSATQLSIDDPVLVPGQCGANTIVGSGDSAVAGATVSQSAAFNVVCPGATTTSKGGLAFTGANLLRWSAIGAVLIGLGSFLVMARRRRASTIG